MSAIPGPFHTGDTGWRLFPIILDGSPLSTSFYRYLSAQSVQPTLMIAVPIAEDQPINSVIPRFRKMAPNIGTGIKILRVGRPGVIHQRAALRLHDAAIPCPTSSKQTEIFRAGRRTWTMRSAAWHQHLP